MKLTYRFCSIEPAADCAECQEPVQGTYAFELDHAEYDPFGYLVPQHQWLCSEGCVKQRDGLDPTPWEAPSDDNLPRDAAHRQEQARRMK